MHPLRCSSARRATRPRPSSSSTRVSSVAVPSRCDPTSSRDADARACPRGGAEAPPNGAGAGCVRVDEARRLGVAPRRGTGGRMGDDSRAAGARATGGGAEWCWWKWKARGGGGGGGEGRVRECPRRNGVVHPWVGQRSPLKCNVLKRELRREVPARED